MERLTFKSHSKNGTEYYRYAHKWKRIGNTNISTSNKYSQITQKLGKLEDIEEELGIPLEVLFKVLKQGYIWMWDINGYYKVSIIKLVCSLEKNENGEDKCIWEFDIRYTGRPIGTRDNLRGIEFKNYNELSKFYKWWSDNPEEE